MNRSDITNELKKYSPHSIKATLRDGTEKAVAVPKNRNRWSRAQQTLDSVPWVSIELLDKDGKLLHLIEDDEELDALADDEDDEGRGIAKLMLEVMRSTMKETRLMMDVQMKAMAQAMSALTDAQSSLVETYRAALQTQAQYQLAAPAESDTKEMMTMFQMAMHLMQQQRAAAAKSAGGG